MPELTLGRMAKLYGLHRSTLYEAVAKGRVTAGFDGKGQRVIELSEMIRVYGEAPGQPDTHPTPSPDTHPTPGPTPDTYRELLDELRALREEVRELREAMRTLPAPGQLAAHPDHREERPGDPPRDAAPADEDAPSATQDRPPARTFADLLERLNSRV